MEIEINRVYTGQSDEQNDILRKKMIYYSSIESVEASEKNYTKITLSWGEEMLIDTEYDEFITYLVETKNRLEDEARERNILGD